MSAVFDVEVLACATCHGFGVLATADGRGAVPCRCRAGSIADARRRGARIPERYQHCTLTNFRTIQAYPSQGKAKAYARRWVEEYPTIPTGVLFVGPPGVGKTHLSVAILQELIETKGARGVFCDFTELLGRIQATYGKASDLNAEDVIAPYRDAELLVLDELGAGKPSEWTRDVLYLLLNTRYNRGLRTILTTNYMDEPARPGDETLELRVGSTMRSRLAEMCQLVIIDGRDHRRFRANPPIA